MMVHKRDTLTILEEALDRVLSGNTNRIMDGRKISIRAIEQEAGLSNGAARYYEGFIRKVKKIITSNQTKSNKKVFMKSDYLRRIKDEKRKKENYRDEVIELKNIIASQAQHQHEIERLLFLANKKIDELKFKLVIKRRNNIHEIQ